MLMRPSPTQGDTGAAAYAIYAPQSPTSIVHTCGPYSNPPNIITLEIVPIIHAIQSFSQLPRTPAYTIYTDSQAAIRALQQRKIPADLRVVLDETLHTEPILGHHSVGPWSHWDSR
ncbi:unnamed protein product [Ixodes hexagonus]